MTERRYGGVMKEMIASVNPWTGTTTRTFEEHSPAEVERRLSSSCQAFADWRKTPFSARASFLLRAAAILEAETKALGRIITGEMGKTIVSAEAEVAKCATACRYYASEAEKILAEEWVPTSASHSCIRYQPLGPVLAIMPWNFPFWQVFRFAAPALMAGNTCLLKHAPGVPQCSLAIEDLLVRSGFPEGVFLSLLLENENVERVIEDDRVAAITLTGSERAGKAVASQAGKRIMKSVLELGGSDPFIVMPSADLSEAASAAVRSRTINSGQSCIAAKRFIVADAIYDHFEERFVAGMKALRLGDPMDPSIDQGPLAGERFAEALDDQVQRAIASGARALTGGHRVPGTKCFYEPTVLVDVPRTADVYREEFFGPVAMLFRARDAHEAIEIANDTPFGLGSSVWTRDAAEQELFIESIEAGQVFVNAIVASDPRIPFGGIKRSGYGRELGVLGIREFVNAKTIWIQ